MEELTGGRELKRRVKSRAGALREVVVQPGYVVFQHVQRHVTPRCGHRGEHVVRDEGVRLGLGQPRLVVGDAAQARREAPPRGPPHRAALVRVDEVDGRRLELVVPVQCDELGAGAAAGHPHRPAGGFDGRCDG